MSHIHHVPGRLRVRLPKLKRDPAYAERVKIHVDQISGVRSSETNPLTGSVVIYYDPAETSFAKLIAALRDSGYAHEEPRREEKAQSKRGEPLARKVAEGVVWFVIETALERSIPLLIAAVL